jgi:serine/threonine-protein kinase
MEFVPGVDLEDLLSAGPLPISAALEIVQEVLSALCVAYDRPTATGEVLRLLHRDIKPANIQLTPTGEVKVLDFGIARAEFSEREAQTLHLRFGSIKYMSPERFEGTDTHGGDVYSCGAVLFELLTGRKFGKTSLVLARHDELVDQALRAVLDLTDDDALAKLLGEMLEFEPENRPSARDAEKRVRQVRLRYLEPSLAEVAEQRVGTAPRRDAAIGVDDLCGQYLVESGGRRTPAPVQRSTPAPVQRSTPAPATPRDVVRAHEPTPKPAPGLETLFSLSPATERPLERTLGPPTAEPRSAAGVALWAGFVLGLSGVVLLAAVAAGVAALQAGWIAAPSAWMTPPEAPVALPPPDPAPVDPPDVRTRDTGPLPEPVPKPVAPPRPRAPTARSLVADGWKAIDRGDLPAATHCFEQAIVLDPGLPEAHYGYGYILLENGKTEAGLLHLCAALRTGDAEVKRDISGLFAARSLSCDNR